jgi:hypothetical protein
LKKKAVVYNRRDTQQTTTTIGFRDIHPAYGMREVSTTTNGVLYLLPVNLPPTIQGVRSQTV